MELERRQIAVTPEIPVSLEVRDSEDGLPKIVGYSAVFGVDTEIQSFFGSFKERLQKGAFRRAIREGQDVRALRNHNPDNLLGRTTAKTLRLKEDDTGLYIEVDPPNTTTGKDTVESIRRGDLSGMSFAFIVRKEKWINGEDGGTDLRIIQDVDLYDVGPVTYPAYDQTTADVRSASKAYQVGLAELGREVPRLPEVEKKDNSPAITSDADLVASAPVELPLEPPAELPTDESVRMDFRARLRLVQAQKQTSEMLLKNRQIKSGLTES